MKKIRVLIVDDHTVLRAGLRLLIASQENFEVVGEAGDGAAAIGETRRLQPDVVVLDLGMMKQPGIPTIAQLRKEWPKIQILVLTMHADPSYLRLALTAGATGYLTKAAAHSELLSALYAVANGLRFVDRSFDSETLFEVMLGSRKSRTESRGSLTPLSPREREVFDLLARGHTNRQIGEQLGVSVKSAETYRARVMEKLGLRNRADLVGHALACGILPGYTDSCA